MVANGLIWPQTAILLLHLVQADTDVEGLVCLDGSINLIDGLEAGVGDHGQNHHSLMDLLS